MWDNSAPSRWRFRFPVTTQVLGVALTVSLSFLAYLLLRPDVRAVAFAPMSPAAHASAVEGTGARTTSGGAVAGQAQGGPSDIAPSTQVSATAEVSTTRTAGADVPMNMTVDLSGTGSADAATPENVDAALGQLQEMQRTLQAASEQLGLGGAAGAPLPVVSASTGTASGNVLSQSRTSGSEADVSAMMAEIDQLYQVMQPLMERLQNASQSSQMPSDLAAMRTQMDDIHRRLTDLMQRVQAAKAAATTPSGGQAASLQGVQQAGPGVNNSGPGNQGNPDQATLDQLQQSMSQMQTLLQQLQSGAASNHQ